MISVKAFEAEITDLADIYIASSRGGTPTASDKPFLFVVLPSFSFKVRLTKGNLRVLREFLDVWSPKDDLGDN